MTSALARHVRSVRLWPLVIGWLSCGVLAFGVACGLPGAAGAATFGANVGTLFPNGQAPGADLPAELQALRATGATIGRSDSNWATTEPAPPVDGVHTYDWSYDDSVVGALAAAGLRWEPIIDYATAWAANPNGGIGAGVAPAYVGDYVAYAAAIAARYGPGGTFWAQHPDLVPEPVFVYEVWNEEDLAGFWGPEPDLAEYATMYAQTRAVIEAVEPEAKVIIGGLIYPAQSLSTMIDADPALKRLGNVDGVAIHAYRPTVAETLQTVAAGLSADEATVDAPLYVNEYGWQTGGNNNNNQLATEANRDIFIEQVTAWLGQNPHIADVEIYCWGLSPFALYGTPAASAFAAGIAAGQSKPAQETTPPAPVPKTTKPTSHRGTTKSARARETTVSVDGHAAKVGVSCTGEPTTKCSLTVSLTVTETIARRQLASPHKRTRTVLRTVKVGDATASLAAGHSEIVRVALNGTGRRLLTANADLKVRLTINETVAHKLKIIAAHTLTFRAQRPRHSRRA
jgi:Glycosyl hydrolase catalytic core